GAYLAPTAAGRAHGMITKRPHHRVEIVDELFDDVITGQPGVVEPIAKLELEVAPVRLPLPAPQARRVVVAPPGDQLADLAAVDALVRFDVRREVPILRAGDEADALLLDLLVRLEA